MVDNEACHIFKKRYTTTPKSQPSFWHMMCVSCVSFFSIQYEEKARFIRRDQDKMLVRLIHLRCTRWMQCFFLSLSLSLSADPAYHTFLPRAGTPIERARVLKILSILARYWSDLFMNAGVSLVCVDIKRETRLSI
jgi:hypothetical protein